MSDYVNPQLRDRLESLPIELKNHVLSKAKRLDSIEDLNAAIESIDAVKQQEENSMPDISAVASSMECTGLMPSAPVNDAEFASYQQLYNMEIPKKDNRPPDSD